MKIAAIIVLLTGALAAGGWFWQSTGAAPPSFREATVERDALLVTLPSTGTLEPEEVIDVGAQVAGKVSEFGRDTKSGKEVDYGSTVEPETVLALIDDALYKEEVELSKAACRQAHSQKAQAELAVKQSEANILRAEADLTYAKARKAQADRDRARGERLRNSNAISLQELDTLQSNAEQMTAQVNVSEAALVQAKTTLESTRATIDEAQGKVDQSEAQLRKAEANLGYTTIRSPIHGVIIDRRVNIGQTVVSSLNAPSLFLIAKDLTRLEIWASVNEADIGQIRIGQKVKFSVDAHPDDSFAGEVSQIRLNATMTQNVVTYTVVIAVDNKDKKLLPYLTANLQFEVAKKEGVLLVPNAALRWQPKVDLVHADYRNPETSGGAGGSTAGGGGGRGGAGGPPGGSPGGGGERGVGGPGGGGPGGGGPGGRGRGGPAARNRGIVWVEHEGLVRPIPVKVGSSDGIRTEISGDDVKEGMKVVLGEVRKSDADGKTVNPFQPQIFNRRRSE